MLGLSARRGVSRQRLVVTMALTTGSGERPLQGVGRDLRSCRSEGCVVEVPFWVRVAVLAFVVVVLAIDLFAHRHAHVIGVREAAAWSGVWVAFGVIVWAAWGRRVRPAVLRRLPARKVTGPGQRLRLGDHLQLLRRPSGVPAPGAVPRCTRSPGLPRHLHRRRRRVDPELRLDSLRLRCVPALHRVPDDPPAQRAPGPREVCRAAGPSAASCR